MFDAQAVTTFQDIIPNADSVIVALPAKPNYEKVATALALATSLKEQGKNVELACPDDVSQLAKTLPGSDTIQQKIGSRNLSIGFAYDEDAVDSVSYHISEDKSQFYLLVKPKRGHAPLDTNTVEFDYVGAEADVIILVGVHDFDQLEHLYQGFEDVYNKATVISLHTFKTEIGSIQLAVDSNMSLAEGVYSLFQDSQFPVSADIATNLLAGIESVHQSFASFSTTASTFEIASELMKLGARRVYREPSKNPLVDKKQSEAMPAKKITPKPEKNKETKIAGSLDYQPSEGGVGLG